MLVAGKDCRFASTNGGFRYRLQQSITAGQTVLTRVGTTLQYARVPVDVNRLTPSMWGFGVDNVIRANCSAANFSDNNFLTGRALKVSFAFQLWAITGLTT
jgi:hypothetical protein